MTETYDVPIHKPPQSQNTPMNRGICLGVRFIDRDPNWNTRSVIETIQIRLYPNSINRGRGIEIPEAWIPMIKKHNSQSTKRRTYEETTSNSWNYYEVRNAPISANQHAINCDT